MSYFLHDPDEWETVVQSAPCPCGGQCSGCCTGSLSFNLQRRSPEAVARIKADKRRIYEDAILAEAENIRRKRLS